MPQEASSSKLLEYLKELLEEHRNETGERPEETPVSWKDIGMTFGEAKMLVKVLEEAKESCEEEMSGVQTGGEITKVAVVGAGLTAMVAGVALMCFPPTASAGIVTLISGAGATKVGEIVGEGIQNIGVSHNSQKVRQIDEYIDSLKNAIIESVP